MNHDGGNLKETTFIKMCYSTLRERNGVWFDTRHGEGSTVINLLKPNDIYIYIYIYRIAALTSRRYILNIYSTNIHTEYFKHAA